MVYDFAVQYLFRTFVYGGPDFRVTDEISVGAHDVFRATVPKGGGTIILDTAAETIGTVTFVSIVSDNYTNLAFQVGEGDSIVFDGPLVLVGAGQVALLGAALASITFTNTDTESDANVEVCIGQSEAGRRIVVMDFRWASNSEYLVVA